MTDPPPSDYGSKVHAERTQDHCVDFEDLTGPARGRRVMLMTFDHIPPGDTERAEYYCEYLMAAVRKEYSIAMALEKYAERCK